MKKLFITLLLLFPVLTGCTTVNTNLKINNNKSASVEVNLRTNKPIKPLEIKTIKSNYNKFLDKNYEIKNNSAKGILNYSAFKQVKNLKKEDLDLSSLGFVSKLKSKRYIDVKQNFFVTSYNIHMIYNFKPQIKRIKFYKIQKEENAIKSVLYPEYFQKYADKTVMLDDSSKSQSDFINNFEPNTISKEETSNSDNEDNAQKDYTLYDINNFNSKFSITLPMPASYNNADKSENNIYYWNLRRNAPTDIKLQYVVYSGFAITFIILAGILLLVYVAKRIWRHDMLKRIGNNN